MKKLLIIKTGTTYPSIRKNYGDFENFILDKIHIPNSEVLVSSIYLNQSLPDIKDVFAIIITGSHSMVTDNDPWNIYLSKWLKEQVPSSIPVLGICYGHQLLAQTFGGNVDYNSKGIEIGTVKISLTQQGETDPLLCILPKIFFGHVTHAQTVIALPNNGTLLAENNFEPHHAFSIAENMWGLQFHPEFDAEITRGYIKEQADNLITRGYNIDELYASVQEHNYGKLLLNYFIDLV